MAKNNHEKPVGEIVHYFSNIGVAVIKLDGAIKIGDKIRIVGGEDTDFTQTVESMQVEHQNITNAKKGEEIGMKVNEKVRDGYKVYKL